MNTPPLSPLVLGLMVGGVVLIVALLLSLWD
jgi:hypothetical protein